METYSDVKSWLATNPSEEELRKVIILINRGAVNHTRKEVWKKEQYLRKLRGIVKDYDSLEIKAPKDIIDSIKSVTKEVEELKKDLPVFRPRAKKEKVETEK
jgi:hypothetical protein